MRPVPMGGAPRKAIDPRSFALAFVCECFLFYSPPSSKKVKGKERSSLSASGKVPAGAFKRRVMWLGHKSIHAPRLKVISKSGVK